MLINFKRCIDKIKDIRQGKFVEGLKLGFDEIDEFFRFKPTNLNIIMGFPNSGKTHIAIYLMTLYTLKHKIKWLMYSSENESFSLVQKIIEFICVKPIKKISDEEFKKSVDFVYDHFQFIDIHNLYNYRTLLDVAYDVKDFFDYDGFFIDPYNSLQIDKDKLKGVSTHEYHYEAMSEFRLFCQQNEISIWLCMHANTEAMRRLHPPSHDFAGHPAFPSPAAVEHGSKHLNRCDDFLVCHRYTGHPTLWPNTYLQVAKVKSIETGGRPTSLDNPICLSSIVNNVGFKLGSTEIKKPNIVEQLKMPF